ncbi:hypothetical protein C8Q76DRAFT_702649 [Earliella scabrosa]|nr:hypothetical protein C8Q76DRAFT_702649 [Earliella scabrosa]
MRVWVFLLMVCTWMETLLHGPASGRALDVRWSRPATLTQTNTLSSNTDSEGTCEALLCFVFYTALLVAPLCHEDRASESPRCVLPTYSRSSSCGWLTFLRRIVVWVRSEVEAYRRQSSVEYR